MPRGFGERFIDAWPTADPVPWGEAVLSLALPPRPVRLLGLDERQRNWLGERYRFRAGGAGAGPALRLWRVASEGFRQRGGERQEYSLDLYHDPEELWVAGWQFLARLPWSGEALAEIWTCETERGAFLGVVENVLRILTARRVLARGGVVIHSAGLQIDARAHLFWGYSGAGKSTLSRLALAAGHGVISDDLNVVLPGPGGFIVERVPFAGDLGQTDASTGPLPLGGLHRLLKATEDRREPLAPARALASLSACAPFVNVDPHRTEQLLDNLAVLLKATTVDSVYFSPTGNPWSLF